jgi:UDPglucose 6-dehydrogenase
MKITVYGLWHLGSVTAACLADAGYEVVGLDPDAKVVADLAQGKPPLHEPGLAEWIRAGLAAGNLSFTTSAKPALRGSDVLWVTFDTPVNDRDEADVALVRQRLEEVADAIPPRTLVLISSQVPVGFTRALERDWQRRNLRYACTPENLRLGKAIEVFTRPERVIAGVRSVEDQAILAKLFAPFCSRIEWMSVESAEMTKHALNAYLATSVTFINELARLCEVLGADAKEVERGLKSESRIGPRAYLAPGAAFAGGTLARDLCYLVRFGEEHEIAMPLCAGVLASNEVHKSWVRDKLSELLASVRGPVVALLGLTYKPGTSTLRRSTAIEQCLWLERQGVRVQAHDPVVRQLPPELDGVLTLCATPEDALRGADVVIVATEWPEFRGLQPGQFVATMRQPQVIDQNHFLAATLASDPRIRYLATGKKAA